MGEPSFQVLTQDGFTCPFLPPTHFASLHILVLGQNPEHSAEDTSISWVNLSKASSRMTWLFKSIIQM